MPPMTVLGWFHTVIGAAAILTAIYSLYHHKILSAANTSGRAYLLMTLFVASSALMIYNQGGLGPGHALAVLALLALGIGVFVELKAPIGGFSTYLQTAAYTATLLFHMIPAITDFLRRLPVGDPFIESFDSPLLRGFYLAFLLVFIVGLSVQFLWLRKQSSTS